LNGDASQVNHHAVRHILLVEDQAIIALSEKDTLETNGFVVTIASSGEAALEKLAREPEIRLVLMDIDLGRGMDGTQTASRILEERSVPIVFLTNHTERDYVERVREITNYGYIVKNSGEFVLIESIEMAFRLFEANQRIESERSLLRTLMESLPDYLFVKDRESRFITTNTAHLRAVGVHRHEDVVGMTDFDLFPRELAQRYYHDEQRVMETGTALINRIETVVTHDGESRRFLTTKVPWFDDNRVIRGVIGISRDVTDREPDRR